MTEFRVAFEAIFPKSVAELSRDFYARFDGVVAERSGRILLAVYQGGSSGYEAAMTLIPELEALGLCIVRVDQDLVDGPEIAARLGVTRQAVNNWAKGTRGCGFPHPLGSPGGKRLWAWGQITEWASQQKKLKNLDEPPALTLDEATLVDAFLVQRRAAVTVRTVVDTAWSGSVTLAPLLSHGAGKSHASAAGLSDYHQPRLAQVG